MAYKMKPLPYGTTLELLFKHDSASYRQISRLFFNGHEVSTKEIHAITGLSMGSIWAAVKAFRESDLIYITRWVASESGSTSFLPVYRAGNKESVEKPKPKNPMAVINSKRYRDNQRAKAMDQWVDVDNFIKIGKSLVPHRNEQEQYEVNRNYLNWISGGAYG